MGEVHYYPTLQTRKLSLREVRSLAQDHTAWKMQRSSSNPWQSELHPGLSMIFKPTSWGKKVFSVNEEDPPNQKGTCVSLEWPRKEAWDSETDVSTYRPPRDAMWAQAERSQQFLFSNELGITVLSWQEKKTATPKDFLPAQVPRGTEQTQGKMAFWGGSEVWREKTLAGFQVLATPVPLYLYDSALALRQWLESRQREPSCSRIPIFTCSLPSHLASLWPRRLAPSGLGCRAKFACLGNYGQNCLAGMILYVQGEVGVGAMAGRWSLLCTLELGVRVRVWLSSWSGSSVRNSISARTAEVLSTWMLHSLAGLAPCVYLSYSFTTVPEGLLQARLWDPLSLRIQAREGAEQINGRLSQDCQCWRGSLWSCWEGI